MSFSKDCTWHVSFLCWFVILKSVFQIPLWIKFDLLSCILCIHAFITYTWTTFVECTFSKSIIFRVKSTFEPNVLKLIIKTIFINSSFFTLLIINVKIISNFWREWCTFCIKKWHLKKTRIVHFRGLSVSNMQNTFDLCQVLNM